MSRWRELLECPSCGLLSLNEPFAGGLRASRVCPLCGHHVEHLTDWPRVAGRWDNTRYAWELKDDRH